MTTTEHISVGDPGAGVADRVARPAATRRVRSPRYWLSDRPVLRTVAVETGILVVAALDVWLMWQIFPPDYNVQPYSLALSALSCAALLLRRWSPFTALLITVPGFFAGWAQVAAMFALGYLAWRLQSHWKVWVGAGLIWVCRFILWPLSDFVAMSWQEHVLDAIYAVIVAGMPVAIGLLIGARAELAARLADLAASRDRERKLHAQAVRAEERARLAREMHDVVSHDITLIAMQAGALSAGLSDNRPATAETQRTVQAIRKLSTSTLEELRSLVGVLRSGADDDVPQPCLTELDELVRSAGVPVKLKADELPEELPSKVSAAAYRTVQECLTNVRKHAPGATAHVRLVSTPDSLAVEVINQRPERPQSATLPSGGYGLAGLAERARLLGGEFETGETADGGFRVNARYPVSG